MQAKNNCKVVFGSICIFFIAFFFEKKFPQVFWKSPPTHCQILFFFFFFSPPPPPHPTRLSSSKNANSTTRSHNPYAIYKFMELIKIKDPLVGWLDVGASCKLPYVAVMQNSLVYLAHIIARRQAKKESREKWKQHDSFVLLLFFVFVYHVIQAIVVVVDAVDVIVILQNCHCKEEHDRGSIKCSTATL